MDGCRSRARASLVDYLDPALRGERFHAQMLDLRERSWLATSDIGFFVLEREAAAFFLRTRSAIFPGMKIAELFGVEDGPLYEEMRRNIPPHKRRRPSAASPPREPRLHPSRSRPGGRRCAASWNSCGRAWRTPSGASSWPTSPSLSVDDRDGDGAPLEDAPRLHEWSNWIQRQFDGPTLMAAAGADRAPERRVLRLSGSCSRHAATTRATT